MSPYRLFSRRLCRHSYARRTGTSLFFDLQVVNRTDTDTDTTVHLCRRERLNAITGEFVSVIGKKGTCAVVVPERSYQELLWR
jgi:hypothetical protein